MSESRLVGIGRVADRDGLEEALGDMQARALLIGGRGCDFRIEPDERHPHVLLIREYGPFFDA